MKKALAGIITGLWLGIAACDDKRNDPDKTQDYKAETTEAIRRNDLESAVVDELRKSTYCLRVVINYNGGRKEYNYGTAFVIGKSNDKTYLTTAEHAVKQDLLSRQRGWKRELYLVDNYDDTYKSDDIEVTLENYDAVIDSAILSTTKEIAGKGIKTGSRPMIKSSNLFIFGYPYQGEIFLAQCLPLSAQGNADDPALCPVKAGMSGGPVLAYFNERFYFVGQIRAGSKIIFLKDYEVMHYDPVEELKKFYE